MKDGQDAALLAATTRAEGRNPRLEAGTLLGEGRTLNRAGGHDMPGLDKAAEDLGPNHGVCRETGTGDGNQPPSGHHPSKSPLPSALNAVQFNDHHRDYRPHGEEDEPTGSSRPT